MKIKAFFAVQGKRRGPKGEWNLENAGMTQLNLKPNLGVSSVAIPLFFMVAREPNDTAGPHLAMIKLFIDDDQPIKQTLSVSFTKEEGIAVSAGAFTLPVKGPMSCRFELSLPGTSEVMDWPFRFVVG